VFPAAASPVLGRFGPEPWRDGAGAWFRCGDVSVDELRLRGRAGSIRWDLTRAGGGEPLFTFPRAAWERELLPAAQVVPEPSARVTGLVGVGDRELRLDGAPGAVARIYGHGNAERWAWLHADLGDGDVLEIVAAVARRPGLRLLPPLALVQLRVGGKDWPPNPLVAAPRFRARLGTATWSVRGAGLEVRVTIPPPEAVVVGYVDPDGSSATCTNSERASADVRWRDRRWVLDGTAHAEAGVRPSPPREPPVSGPTPAWRGPRSG
jgi:hypothetical protein